MPDTEPRPPSTPVANPLARVALDAERHVAAGGWDQPPRLFALVSTAALLKREPGLRADLGAAPPGSLTAVEQEGLAATSSVGSLLARIAWPSEVAGAALAVERIVVPPEAERDLSADPAQATEALAAHPARRDVRLVVAVLRSGDSICVLRQREHDADEWVASGPDLAPGLVAALRETLLD